MNSKVILLIALSLSSSTITINAMSKEQKKVAKARHKAEKKKKKVEKKDRAKAAEKAAIAHLKSSPTPAHESQCTGSYCTRSCWHYNTLEKMQQDMYNK